MPLRRDKIFFQKFDFRLENGTSASFPSISGSVKGTSASFPSIWGQHFAKIHPGEYTRMSPGESCPQMLGNEALVPFPEPEMLGNEALGAVLMHILEKTLEKLLISEVFALPQCPNYPTRRVTQALNKLQSEKTLSAIFGYRRFYGKTVYFVSVCPFQTVRNAKVSNTSFTIVALSGNLCSGRFWLLLATCELHRWATSLPAPSLTMLQQFCQAHPPAHARNIFH